MVAAHLGLAGDDYRHRFSQNYSVERDVRMRAGDSVTIHGLPLHLPGGAGHHRGPTTAAGWPSSVVTRHGEPEAVLHAEKRLYNTSRMVMTEAGD
ncbi:heme ABC exporter ATP-binding protein [Salmonella enterica subsp. enterica serovar Pullorum]|nr:heme ABC exporter ATP-binding protein [Salmonella enterica subsp. enterica serovar Pullorum]